MAVEEGRDVYAIPGDINKSMSQGCNRLIRDSAHIYTDFEDFAQQSLNIDIASHEHANLTKEEKIVVQALQDGISDGERIADILKTSTQNFNCIITILELKNVVRSLGCNQWALV